MPFQKKAAVSLDKKKLKGICQLTQNSWNQFFFTLIWLFCIVGACLILLHLCYRALTMIFPWFRKLVFRARLGFKIKKETAIHISFVIDHVSFSRFLLINQNFRIQTRPSKWTQEGSLSKRLPNGNLFSYVPSQNSYQHGSNHKKN